MASNNMDMELSINNESIDVTEIESLIIKWTFDAVTTVTLNGESLLMPDVKSPVDFKIKSFNSILYIKATGIYDLNMFRDDKPCEGVFSNLSCYSVTMMYKKDHRPILIREGYLE